jgi:hypothetical protein
MKTQNEIREQLEGLLQEIWAGFTTFESFTEMMKELMQQWLEVLTKLLVD